MKHNVTWRPVAVALFASAWLAGCSGSPTQVNPASPSYLSGQTNNGPAQTKDGPALDGVRPDSAGCNNGPLQVNPCYVYLGNRYGRYEQVTVQYPGGDQLIERNNCRRDRYRHFRFGERVARVRGAGQSWTVISGNRRGYCKAVFTDVNKDVSVMVEIHNARGFRRR